MRLHQRNDSPVAACGFNGSAAVPRRMLELERRGHGECITGGDVGISVKQDRVFVDLDVRLIET